MTEKIETDICVIGGGSGGLSVAAGAAQMGARVVLVEGGKMGGDCLNYGCVPSKALIEAAKHAHAMTTGTPFGVTPVVPRVDYAGAMAHVQNVIAGIAPHDSVERFTGLGVRVIEAYGTFTSHRELAAGNTRIKARRFVIATGSSPLVPPITGLDKVPYLTNETLFELTDAPEHLLVIGGGPIGLEMAQAHRRLGCRVTVLEGVRALGRDDPELAAVALDRLRGEGVEIFENAMVTEISGRAGAITVQTTGSGTHSGSHLLVAVGRKANTCRLNLAAARVAHDRRGVSVDAAMKTSNRRIYAIGDVAGSLQFTHVAGYHASVILRSALFGLPSKAKVAHLPWATYTDPELAHIGLSEADARKRFGEKLEVVRFAYADNDRARASLQTDGLIKVMVHRGRPVGVGIVGAGAGEQIALWSLVLAKRLKMADVAQMVAPYPTLAEIGKRAAGVYFAPRLFESAGVKRMVGLVQRFT